MRESVAFIVVVLDELVCCCCCCWKKKTPSTSFFLSGGLNSHVTFVDFGTLKKKNKKQKKSKKGKTLVFFRRWRRIEREPRLVCTLTRSILAVVVCALCGLKKKKRISNFFWRYFYFVLADGEHHSSPIALAISLSKEYFFFFYNVTATPFCVFFSQRPGDEFSR